MTKARSLSDFIESDGSVTLVDNQKIKVGTGNDLQIYHDGSNSYIEDAGTGNLWFKSNGATIGFGNSDLSELFAVFNKDGASKLYFNNSTKLETTSSGIDVTGTLTADGGTFDGDVTIGGSGSEDRSLVFGMDGRGSAFTGQNAAHIFCGQGSSGDFLAGALYLQSRSSSVDREIAFITGTTPTKKLVIEGSGNTGIGVTSPSSYTFGDVAISNGTTAGLTLVSATTGIGTLAFADGTSGNAAYRGFIQYSHITDGLVLGTDGSTKATIDSSGNLAVTGTVDGRDIATDGTKLDTIDTNANYITNNNQLTNGAGYVTSSGNTIIGTDSDIDTSGATVVDQLNMTDGVIQSHSTRTMTLADLGYTGATNANYITNNNQLSNGAGYTTYSANQTVNTTSNPTFNQIYANDWFRANGNTGIYWQTHGRGWQMSDSSWIRTYGAVGLYVTNGQILATSNITAYYSDERLKDKVGKIENALDKVSQIETFYFKENELAKSFGHDIDKVQVGVSAQSVEKVLPEIVDLAPFDMNDEMNGSKSGEDYMTIDYAKLTPLLIEAIKELKAEIKELKESK